jgi:hypothetical protein
VRFSQGIGANSSTESKEADRRAGSSVLMGEAFMLPAAGGGAELRTALRTGQRPVPAGDVPAALQTALAPGRLPTDDTRLARRRRWRRRSRAENDLGQYQRRWRGDLQALAAIGAIMFVAGLAARRFQRFVATRTAVMNPFLSRGRRPLCLGLHLQRDGCASKKMALTVRTLNLTTHHTFGYALLVAADRTGDSGIHGRTLSVSCMVQLKRLSHRWSAEASIYKRGEGGPPPPPPSPGLHKLIFIRHAMCETILWRGLNGGTAGQTPRPVCAPDERRQRLCAE